MTTSASAATSLSSRPCANRCCATGSRSPLTMVEAERATADLETLAHPIRMRLLDVLLCSDDQVCVCDLEAAVPVKQPTVSHHLKLLREAGLIVSERRGMYVYYRVDRTALLSLRNRIAARLAALV